MRSSGWLLSAFIVMAACGGDEAEPRLRVERDTVGDTIVVRTLAGSVWGHDAALRPEVTIGVFEGEDEYMFGQIASLAVGPDGSIYVMDRQVPALRKYDAEGRYVATFGRSGEGPGEYRNPDGGLATLSDGRVVLRDPANARLQVFSPGGEAVATWPIRGGFSTSNPLTVDARDRVYTQVLLDPQAAVTDWRPGVVAYDGVSGEPLDTIPAPWWDYEAPRLVATRSDDRGTSTSVNGVPFSPQPSWAMSPAGYMVGGLSTRYAIDQYRPDAVLRIERVYEPVSVHPEERADREARTRWNMQRTQPDWRWNGPPIPAEKPPFRQLFAGRDGRIWVLLHQPAERVPDEEIETTDRPDAPPPSRWREPVAFDVFESDGTYLGQVRAPDGFSVYPTPVFDGDRVWAVIRDDLDVQYVVRYRVDRGEPVLAAD